MLVFFQFTIMPKIFITIIVIAIAVLAGIYYIFNLSPLPSVGQTSETPLSTTQATESPSTSPTPQSANKNRMHTITLTTSMGTIAFETYDADAPKTVQNFITLAQKGFYSNLIFHRVIKGFMIQGGDPNGNGTGGPGYAFEDELNPAAESYKQGYIKGMVAMANAGPNTNGSQFFIMLENTPLPHNYTIFGKVISGQNVVDAIGKTQTNSNDKPLTDVVIKSVSVEVK